MNGDKGMVRKETWVAPEIKTLEVGETQTRNARGGDGSRYLDCTRS